LSKLQKTIPESFKTGFAKSKERLLSYCLTNPVTTFCQSL